MVMKNRTAVCQGFANLFQALAKASGIECQVVTGIVKNEKGVVMRVGHAWVAALVLGKWYLFDPTWSTPYADRRWQVNDRYFMIAPEKLILDHLPDDPAWQLLENPLRETDFRENDEEGIRQLLRQKPDDPFRFSDTLQTWIVLDSVARNFAAENRILQFNSSNQRVLFVLGQNNWRQFFDLRTHLDSLADRAILQQGFSIDTAEFSAQLARMDQYHKRARDLFSQISDPDFAAKTEKFFTPADVNSILENLRGAMWTAVFENQFRLRNQQIDAEALQDLLAISDATGRQYAIALRDIPCGKLAGTCFEIWHNLSMMHLQLAECYATYCQNLLAEKNAEQYLKSIETYHATLQILLQKAEAETRQMMQIPPPYAFVRERLLRIQQNMYTLQLQTLAGQRIGLNKQVKNALTNDAVPEQSLLEKLRLIAENLTNLSQTLEDAYGQLGAEYGDAAMRSLQQENLDILLNLASLHFKTAFEMQRRSKPSDAEKKRLESLVQQALTWIQEANQALEWLSETGKTSRESIEQKTIQIRQLTDSIRSFAAQL